jgi:hypothetical protein
LTAMLPRRLAHEFDPGIGTPATIPPDRLATRHAACRRHGDIRNAGKILRFWHWIMTVRETDARSLVPPFLVFLCIRDDRTMDARLTTIGERCVPLGPDGERRRPLAVDLYCGGGGVGLGLFLAGFDVIGYDIDERGEYPFEFVRKSALEAELAEAEFVWASPPCQSFTAIIPTAKREQYGHRWKHENLIPSTREKLVASGKPYVIENVMGAVRELSGPLAMLCGTMFPKLKVFRHRLFESNFGLEVKDRRCSHAGRSLGD